MQSYYLPYCMRHAVLTQLRLPVSMYGNDRLASLCLLLRRSHPCVCCGETRIYVTRVQVQHKLFTCQRSKEFLQTLRTKTHHSATSEAIFMMSMHLHHIRKHTLSSAAEHGEEHRAHRSEGRESCMSGRGETNPHLTAGMLLPR
jgi:hypothetical protein